MVKHKNVKHVTVANISYHNLHLEFMHKLIGLVFHENVSFLSSKTIVNQF